MTMKTCDDVASVLYHVIMSHGTLQPAVIKLEKALEKLEMLLRQSKTGYFHNTETYSMVDLYGFPHVSRIFYCKDTVMDKLYQQLRVEERFPFLYRWVHHSIRGRPELNDGRAIINVRAFQLWLEELVTLPIGKKPPLRLPMKL